LLAKSGQARDQLRQALEAAGASIVLEQDPDSLQCSELEAVGAQVVLVALESGTEDSLSRFDSVLDDPAVTVIYDEAELAARREGWEAQRWARHLRAKLNGHADVLPPGGEIEADLLQPGRPQTPAQIHAGADIEVHREEAQMHSFDLPSGGLQPGTADAGAYLDLEPEAWQPRPALLDENAASEDFAAPAHPEVEPPAAADVVAEQETRVKSDGRGQELSLEAMEQAEESSGPAGALLMFAGIGGPDAVRKVLAELPPAFPRPVLVRLRLDGGRYDNLVKQMSRVSVLPVTLAVAGKQALPMRVYVLPEDVAMNVVDGNIHFSAGETDMVAFIAGLPPADCAILMLSGSDADQVDAISALGAQGAYVAGQSPQGCYDASASKALAERGNITGTPAELAASAVAHLGA
jgi:chemosensory pili system protein ChpB (putative protein-glutamate methylesterase)